MNDTNFLNLFWAIVWGLITVLTVVGIFWNPAQFVAAIIAGCMFVVFVKEYVRIKRMK